MKNKIWLTIALISIICGCSLFVISMSNIKWDFSKLDNTTYITQTYEINDDFNNISIESTTSDIEILSSEDESKVEVYCNENQENKVHVNNKDLLISTKQNKQFTKNISITNKKPYIKIYLTKNIIENLTINSSTGDVTLTKEFSFINVDIKLSTGDFTSYANVKNNFNLKTTTGNVYIKNTISESLQVDINSGKIVLEDLFIKNTITLASSTGKTYVSNVECNTFYSTANTGDININNLKVNDYMNVETTTGDIAFNDCLCQNINLTTSSGDVDGSLIGHMQIDAKSNSGKIEVDKDYQGGICQVRTTTGDIKITLKI